MLFIDVYACIAYLTFLALVIGKTTLTKRQNKVVIALGKNKSGRARALELSFYAGILFLAYLIIIAVFRQQFFGVVDLIVLFKHPFTDWLGFIILNIGIIVFSFAIAAFKDAWRIGIDTETDTLVTNGIFAFSRNPVYIAIILLMSGFFLIYANFFFLGSLIFMIIAFAHQIAREERLLTSIFGAKYEHYKQSTRRLLGKKHPQQSNKKALSFVKEMKSRKEGGDSSG